MFVLRKTRFDIQLDYPHLWMALVTSGKPNPAYNRLWQIFCYKPFQPA